MFLCYIFLLAALIIATTVANEGGSPIVEITKVENRCHEFRNDCKQTKRIAPFLTTEQRRVINKYIKSGTSGTAAEIYVMEALQIIQHSAWNLCGPLVEIGVYMGWYVGLMASLSEDMVYAIDLFGNQTQNFDSSGGGKHMNNQPIKHLSKYVRKLNITNDRFKIIQANSLHLSSEYLHRLLKIAPRIFSVDGGHFHAITFHDLHIATCITSKKGVVVVDDYRNNGWRDVRVATGTLLVVGETGFTPFLATHVKLYLCHVSEHSMYTESFLKWNKDHGEVLNLQWASNNMLGLQCDHRIKCVIDGSHITTVDHGG
jgi:hypothetical protein